jgi:hypothetical protein
MVRDMAPRPPLANCNFVASSGEMMAEGQFTRFAAIDWSGAKGKRHKGIAVAVCEAGKGAPRLIERERPWSRIEVLDWVLETADEAPTLYGFDLSGAFAFADRGGYFPGWDVSPEDVRGLWRLVEEHCATSPIWPPPTSSIMTRRAGISDATAGAAAICFSRARGACGSWSRRSGGSACAIRSATSTWSVRRRWGNRA